MLKRNNERLNRDRALQLLINANSLVWQNLTGFADSFALFNNHVQSAINADATASADIKGAATVKWNKRIIMADMAMLIKGGVQAYATSIGDVDLFNSVNFRRSKITNGKANVAQARCLVIFTQANTVINALLPFGITPQLLTTFESVVNEFGTFMSLPSSARAARKVANEQVTMYLTQADKVLDNSLTGLMENFRTSAPTFYERFFAEKRLIHGATRYTEVTAYIKSAATSEPLYGVEMEIINPQQQYIVTSDVYGKAFKKQMKPSLYDITFTAPGFEAKTIHDVDIARSEHESMNVVLVPLS